MIPISDQWCLRCGHRHRPARRGVCNQLVLNRHREPVVCGGPLLRVLVDEPAPPQLDSLDTTGAVPAAQAALDSGVLERRDDAALSPLQLAALARAQEGKGAS